jgi:acyl dehydratase
MTTADNIWFHASDPEHRPDPLRPSHYASQTEFGKPLVNSALTLAVVTGQSVIDISQNVVANLGWDEVRLPNPVFEGDTIYSRSEVLECRESKSRKECRHRHVRTTGFNQEGTEVITFRRTVMVYRRGQAPRIARLKGQ